MTWRDAERIGLSLRKSISSLNCSSIELSSDYIGARFSSKNKLMASTACVLTSARQPKSARSCLRDAAQTCFHASRRDGAVPTYGTHSLAGPAGTPGRKGVQQRGEDRLIIGFKFSTILSVVTACVDATGRSRHNPPQIERCARSTVRCGYVDA